MVKVGSEELLDVDEAASYTGLSRHTIHGYASRGLLHPKRLPKGVTRPRKGNNITYFNKRQLDALMRGEQRTSSGVPEVSMNEVSVNESLSSSKVTGLDILKNLILDIQAPHLALLERFGIASVESFKVLALAALRANDDGDLSVSPNVDVPEQARREVQPVLDAINSIRHATTDEERINIINSTEPAIHELINKSTRDANEKYLKLKGGE